MKRTNKSIMFQFGATMVAALLILILFCAPIINIKLSESPVVADLFGDLFQFAILKDVDDADDLDEAEDIKDDYEDLYEEIFEDESYISISAIDFISNLPDTVHAVSSWFKTLEIRNLELDISNKIKENPGYYNSDSYRDAMAMVEEYKEELYDDLDTDMITEKSLKYSHLVATTMIQTITGGDTEIDEDTFIEMDQDAVLAVGLYFVFVIIKYILLLLLLFLAPLLIVIRVIIMPFTLLGKNKDPIKKYNGFMKNYKHVLGWVGLYMTNLLIWSANVAPAGAAMLAVAFISIVLNAIMARFKEYNDREKKYLNYMQLCTLVSMVGSIIFAISLAGANLVGFYTGGDVCAEVFDNADNEIGFTLFFLLIIVMSFVFLPIFKGIIRMFTRVACMGNNSGKKNNDRSYSVAATGIFIIILNIIVLGIYGLEMDEEQIVSMVLAGVGLVIILGGQILLAYLEVNKIDGLTDEEKQAVLCGHSTGIPAEIVVEPEKKVEITEENIDDISEKIAEQIAEEMAAEEADEE